MEVVGILGTYRFIFQSEIDIVVIAQHLRQVDAVILCKDIDREINAVDCPKRQSLGLHALHAQNPLSL